MDEYVQLERVGAVGVLRWERPPVNWVNFQLAQEVSRVVAGLVGDSGVGAVVVCGEGGIFSAGEDEAELGRLSGDQAGELVEAWQRDVLSIASLPQPSVAAISGYALGAGLEMALGADRRIAGDNVELGFPQVHSGRIPAGGIGRLVELVGVSRAKDLVFTGRSIGPAEARDIGLIDDIVAPDAVFDTALAWAQHIAALPTDALRAAKAVFGNTADPDLLARARTRWPALVGSSVSAPVY